MEAIALVLAGAHSAQGQLIVSDRDTALKELFEWLAASPDNQRSKRLLGMRRLILGRKIDYANRVIEGKWSDEW